MLPSRHLPLPPQSFWSRERGDRYRYDPLTDRYGRGLDFSLGIEDLSIDGRGRTSDVRVVDFRTIDPRYLDSRPNPSGRGYPGQFESSFPRGHRDLRPRPNMAGRKTSVSFGRGMKKLSRALQKAEDYFTNFLAEYDNDMLSTERYATLGIREELWCLKVAGKRDKRINKDEQNPLDDEGEKPRQKFEEKKKDLNHALQLALNVRLEDERPTARAKARIDSAERLQSKIEVATGQISDLLNKAATGRDHCASLLDEINMLKTLVDPELETNRDLFKLVDGEQDGASDAEEDDRGGQAWENGA
ncbi:hypothetical protein EG329_004003 [Mollisiaceae sp. DMI_Dod_QoI]|nr:hypothetical protein EG329_004003 [Helotiales sp. DMI_Dod_QoI]